MYTGMEQLIHKSENTINHALQKVLPMRENPQISPVDFIDLMQNGEWIYMYLFSFTTHD